jgi:hypothetical protein
MIGELGELLDWIKAGFSGWQYLFSTSYRQKKKNDWKNEKIIYIIWDVLCGTAGIIFTLLIIYLVFSFIRSN